MKLTHLFMPMVFMTLAGCNNAKEKPKEQPKPAGASTQSVTPGSAGSGDGSGSSIANARALRPGAPVSFTLGCNATVYFGPFAFTKDPETLTFTSSIKSPTGSQICVNGDFIDKSGAHAGGASIGCVDGEHVGGGKSTFEYSPGNGGNGTNPIYLKVSFNEAKPEGCPSLDVTFKM